MDEERTVPEPATRDAEIEESKSRHTADRPPTQREERQAEEACDDPELSGEEEEVGGHYQEMTERGISSGG